MHYKPIHGMRETGYFGYVMHDKDGKPKGIYRYKDGSNFNRGLDGVSPLIAKHLLQRTNKRDDKPCIFS